MPFDHNDKLKFFISRAGEDQEWGEWIAQTLADAGHRYFLQDHQILPGQSFVQRMEEAMDKCDHFIAVMSPEYLAKEITMWELGSAARRDPLGAKRLVLIVRVRPCKVPALYDTRVLIECTQRDEDARNKLLSCIAGLSQTSPTFSAASTKDLTPAGVLAEQVESQWINGYLNPILEGSLVDFDIPFKVYKADSTNSPVSNSALREYVWDIRNVGRRLLISGDAGSGKSIRMLRCVRDLLPAQDDGGPRKVPVVFNIGTWVDPTKSVEHQIGMEEWIRRELYSQYGLTRAYADNLINNKSIIYCLDGFHEISPGSDEAEIGSESFSHEKHASFRKALQTKFVEELQRFMGKQSAGGSTGLIMTIRTSRPEEVLQLEVLQQLKCLHVRAEPLDIEALNPRLPSDELKNLARNNERIRTLLTNPLQLHMWTTVFARGSKLDRDTYFELQSTDTNALIDHVYDDFCTLKIDAYVRREFQSGPAAGDGSWYTRFLPDRVRRPFSAMEMSQYMSSIATYLQNRSRLTNKSGEPVRRMFRLDELQPSELPARFVKSYLTTVSLVFAAAVFVTAGIPVWIAVASEWGMDGLVARGLLKGSLAAFAVGIAGGGVIALGYRFLRGAWFGASVGLAFGLVRGFVVGLSSDVPGYAPGMSAGVQQGIVTIAFCAPLFAWIMHYVKDDPLRIEPIEMWETDSGKTLYSLVAATVIGICFWKLLGPARGIAFGAFIGLALVVLFGRRRREAPIMVRPNQAIRYSADYSVGYACTLTLACVIIFGAVYGIFHGYKEGVNNALLALGCLVLFFFFGGLPVLKHFALRITLRRKGLAPLQLVRFLKAASSAGFMQQVGGGFMFLSSDLVRHLSQEADANSDWGTIVPPGTSETLATQS